MHIHVYAYAGKQALMNQRMTTPMLHSMYTYIHVYIYISIFIHIYIYMSILTVCIYLVSFSFCKAYDVSHISRINHFRVEVIKYIGSSSQGARPAHRARRVYIQVGLLPLMLTFLQEKTRSGHQSRCPPWQL